MIRIPDARIDQLLAEDVPGIDLTTEALGIGERSGRMECFTRQGCVLAGGSVAARVMERLGAAVESRTEDGARLGAGDVFLTVRGTAAQLHMGWKLALNLCDRLSGVATATRAMVDAAHAANPACQVLTTRKSLPGARDLLTLAVMAGGAWPHRLGLSETVLVFAQHVAFLGGLDGLLARLPAMRAACVEKRILVEAAPDEALVLARGASGRPLVDGIQLDKVPSDELGPLVRELRAIDPRLILIAAGSISEQNAGAHAATGVDGLATTAPLNAAPIDMSVRMHAMGRGARTDEPTDADR